MPRDVRGVMRPNSGALQRRDASDVNNGGIQQGVSETAPAGERRQLSLRQPIGQRAAERQAVGLNAGAGQHHDSVAIANIADDSIQLWTDPSQWRSRQAQSRRARQYL